MDDIKGADSQLESTKQWKGEQVRDMGEKTKDMCCIQRLGRKQNAGEKRS